MILTDAVNAFFRQSLNESGLPYKMNQNSEEVIRQKAIALLMADIKAGEDSVKSELVWISEEDMLTEFGVQA